MNCHPSHSASLRFAHFHCHNNLTVVLPMVSHLYCYPLSLNPVHTFPALFVSFFCWWSCCTLQYQQHVSSITSFMLQKLFTPYHVVPSEKNTSTYFSWSVVVFVFKCSFNQELQVVESLCAIPCLPALEYVLPSGRLEARSTTHFLFLCTCHWRLGVSPIGKFRLCVRAGEAKLRGRARGEQVVVLGPCGAIWGFVASRWFFFVHGSCPDCPGCPGVLVLCDFCAQELSRLS